MNSSSERISLGSRDIHLIGTAHVSRESIDEVAQVIREERPDVVCVELDEGRYASITQKESWEHLNVSKVFKEGKGFLLIANLVLSSFQRRMGNDLGVKPGEEMKTAIETANELGIRHSLCDREIQTTLRRAWARCGLWSKCKLLAALLSSALTTEKFSAEEIENLKDRNELEGMMAEVSDFLPGVKETLIDERDHYLAAKIWEAARQPTANGAACRAVAVVGAGHIPGIQSYLQQFAATEAGAEATATAAAETTAPASTATPAQQPANVAALDTIPPPDFLSRAAKWIIPALILALIVAGYLRFDFAKFLEMVWYWILCNGGLAALGCIIALGHPLAIVVSFLCAPFTTFVPVIGVGMISGLVQAALCKPRVMDAQTISEDVATLKGVYRNRISRALLVFFLSSLGSSIGTFVAIPAIASLLAG